MASAIWAGDPMPCSVNEVVCNPPPYLLQPTIEPFVSTYEDRKYPLKVETDLQQRRIDAGQFLTGTVSVQALASVEKNVSVNLTLWSKITTYKQKGKYFAKRSQLLQSNMIRLKRSIIPLVCPLEEGLCYSYPFSIQFPELDEMPQCKCDCPHSASPPSCVNDSVHVEYYLTAIVRDHSKRCWQSFYYQPTSCTFDWSKYRDEQGQTLMRMHRSVRSQRLSASAWPIYNTPDQLSGYARLYIQSNVRIDMIKTQLDQHTAIKAEGFSDVIPADALHEVKHISQNTLVGSWPAGTDQIDVPYELPTRSVQPSHVGCYSAVLYFLKLELHSGSEVCKLQIPLSICTLNEETPEYPVPEAIKI